MPSGNLPFRPFHVTFAYYNPLHIGALFMVHSERIPPVPGFEIAVELMERRIIAAEEIELHSLRMRKIQLHRIIMDKPRLGRIGKVGGRRNQRLRTDREQHQRDGSRTQQPEIHTLSLIEPSRHRERLDSRGHRHQDTRPIRRSGTAKPKTNTARHSPL